MYLYYIKVVCLVTFRNGTANKHVIFESTIPTVIIGLIIFELKFSVIYTIVRKGKQSLILDFHSVVNRFP
jgi:hypothetical protein